MSDFSKRKTFLLVPKIPAKKFKCFWTNLYSTICSDNYSECFVLVISVCFLWDQFDQIDLVTVNVKTNTEAKLYFAYTSKNMTNNATGKNLVSKILTLQIF